MPVNIVTIGFAILVFIVLWGISAYNKMVSARELIKNSMGQIAAQIESRWDALTSLIEATKKYADHEADVLMDITRSRGGITRTSDVDSVEKDSVVFGEALGKLDIVVENYPDLKASTVYSTTMEKIDLYENNVRSSRMIYNDTVTKFNRMTLVFPSSILASIFGFGQEEYFESTDKKSDMPSWS